MAFSHSGLLRLCGIGHNDNLLTNVTLLQSDIFKMNDKDAIIQQLKTSGFRITKARAGKYLFGSHRDNDIVYSGFTGWCDNCYLHHSFFRYRVIAKKPYEIIYSKFALASN